MKHEMVSGTSMHSYSKGVSNECFEKEEERSRATRPSTL